MGVEIDRIAISRAALLAGFLGVSPQHALGSLVAFWLLCEEDSAKRFSGEEVEARWRLASGRHCPASILVVVCFLEESDGGFRVRGIR